MENLSNSIYSYYVTRFDELPFDKQLHFASRLYLWSSDSFGAQKLSGLREQVTNGNDPAQALRTVYNNAMATIFHGSKNAAELRAPYFEKYPEIRAMAMVLFRLTFLDSIYGLDTRATFFDLFDKTSIEDVLARLHADHEAIAILSTHAVNVFYLYNRVVLRSETFDPRFFLKIGDTQYDLDNSIHLQLFIYLYTHCIIGESCFYARKIPAQHLDAYHHMADDLEQVLAGHFASINLDNKFEFLVCCRLLNRTSHLEDRIFEEAAQSVSDTGTFLIDRHNRNPQINNVTFDLSEHRNVLYLLANRVFAPSGQPM
jgi:hypothetical protein